MKKIFCIILTLILWVSLCMPVFGADKAEGTTIRLTKAEGNGVSVTTNGDKALKVAENMRLFSGYRVITDKNSFAYLSLDDSKAVKLDKNTKVKIVKQGNKNQVSVSTGKLFFNVSKKLAPDESMEVQASNVSMGIRGTSGELTTTLYANAKSGEPESRTELQLFEGTLDVKITNSKTGEIEIYHMVDGTKIDVLTYKDQAAVDVLVTLLTAGDLSSSAINEILSDPRLSALVEEGSGFTHEALKKAAEDAANRETEEQARRELEEKTAQSQSGSQTNITTEVPPETKPDRGGRKRPCPKHTAAFGAYRHELD